MQIIVTRCSSLLILLLLCLVTVKGQSIYKTPYGKKYHLAGCRMVKNVSEKITPEQAVELGLEPCMICKPAISKLQPAMGDKSAGQGKTVQCKGLTKKGIRCRHMTNIGNGYCFQHQPK
ncbi:MAG: DUF5763 domain-containing protein [Chitinophagaceae bacterium]